MAFKKPSCRKKDTLVCVGTLGSFGSLVQSKTEGSPYYMEKVEIKPGGDSLKASFRLLWEPRYFGSDFDPSTLDKGQTFVYKKNIASLDNQSLLEGLSGDNDTWEQLQEAIVGLGDDPDADSVHDLLAEFFGNLGPVPFIYILKQERKQDGFKADGSKRYVAGEYYEVDEIQHLTEKNVKALVKRVTKNQERIDSSLSDGKEAPARILFKFDPTDYGVNVEVPQLEPTWVG